MSLDTPYDPENIFAKIIAGDMPCVKLYEDDDTLAFMDVFPQSEGHCLVVHKTAPATNLLAIDQDALASVINTVQRVTKGGCQRSRPGWRTRRPVQRGASGTIGVSSPLPRHPRL